MRFWLRPLGPALTLVLLTAVAVAAQAVSPVELTRAQMADFLVHAKVVKSAALGKGKTKPRRLTLTDGTITHDAVFQNIDEKVERQTFPSGRVEFGFRDSYHYNIAGYRLAELLGIGDMVPVAVERAWDGSKGSLSWWVEWEWDEMDRRKQDVRPPRELAIPYSNQLHLSRLFGELVYDTDRNQTNTLISKDWKLYMVDFTRAFRVHDMLQHPESIQRCSRELLERLRGLTRDAVVEAVGSHLTPMEVNGIMKRRDRVVARIEELVKERGEAAVLFSAQ